MSDDTWNALVRCQADLEDARQHTREVLEKWKNERLAKITAEARAQRLEAAFRLLKTWTHQPWGEYKRTHPDAAEFADDEFTRIVDTALAAGPPPPGEEK